MSEGLRHTPDHSDEQLACVKRYEAMSSSGSPGFFDVEEFELIMDHYLANNEARKAQVVLEHAKAQHPDSVDITFCEALVHMGMGRLNKGLEILDALEKVEPFNEEIQLHKAGIFSQQRNYRRAIEYYRRALQLAEEGLDDIYLDLAFEHENLEEYDEAISCLKKAADLNPENEAVLHELAYCFDLAGADDASVAYFKEFTNDQPYSAVGWYSLGNVLSKLERMDESNEALDLALAIDERFTSAYFSRARNMLIAGDYENAIACYEETLVFDGPQAITFSFIGECYEKMERYEQALIHYDQSIHLDPTWVDAWIGRGVVKDVLNRLPEAIRDLENATRIAPDNPDAWYYYANALARSERFADALLSYTRLNTIEPASLEGWMDHADLLMQLKGPEAALAKFREGEMVHKLNPKYKYRLASYLLRCGKEQQALLELEEALSADFADHTQFMEHYPEGATLPQVLHLVELYRK
jgi:tetratricopeptide (TPR) repeat protein